MPHVQLASRALYRTPKLPDALAALDFTGNASGYAELERQLSRERGSIQAVSNRSVQLMLYQGQFLKHAKCLNIRQNLVAYEELKGLKVVDADNFIEEHEWYVSKLQKTLETIAFATKSSLTEIVASLAEASGRTSDFIYEMLKYRRCLQSEADAVCETIVSQHPDMVRLGKVIVDNKMPLLVARDPISGRESLPIAWSVREPVEAFED